jgi:large subunit ribosomal protein L18
MAKTSRQEKRRAVHTRIRKKVAGTPERPRLAIFRSLNHIYAQVIDDRNGATLCSASSLEKTAGADNGGNIDAAKVIGKLIAERAKEKGINTVVFDRGGYIYHGRVKSLAEAAREAGLQF